MKKLYNNPEIELIYLASEDVCSASDTEGLVVEENDDNRGSQDWGTIKWGSENKF
ncbi:MAG: hypothetical protein IJX94_03270 [Clostridia bacterium]|nr:hypothetical protein [Clostridia bacterium]